MDSEIQETLELFREAFATFNTPKINVEQFKESKILHQTQIPVVFTVMEMPPLSEEEFQLQFTNLDQDQVIIRSIYCSIMLLRAKC